MSLWLAARSCRTIGESMGARPPGRAVEELAACASTSTAAANRSASELNRASIEIVLAEPPRLSEATPLEGYSVYLRFEDGLAAAIDLSYLLEFGGVFEPLGDIEFFRKLEVDECSVTICWPNEADIAPDRLYNHVQRAVYAEKLRRAARSRTS